MKFKTYAFWVALSGAVVLLVESVAEMLGFKIESSTIENVIMSICGVLVVLGIVTKPSSAVETQVVSDEKNITIIKESDKVEQQISNNEQLSENYEVSLNNDNIEEYCEQDNKNIDDCDNNTQQTSATLLIETLQQCIDIAKQVVEKSNYNRSVEDKKENIVEIETDCNTFQVDYNEVCNNCEEDVFETGELVTNNNSETTDKTNEIETITLNYDKPDPITQINC